MRWNNLPQQNTSLDEIPDTISQEEYAEYLKTGKFPWEKKKQNKYKANKTEIDGIIFDSYKEAARYKELLMLEKLNMITDLRRQVVYTLIPEQRDETGKIAERAVTYKADFVYKRMDTGEEIIEDTKGMRTKDYIIKRKLMRYQGHPIREM